MYINMYIYAMMHRSCASGGRSPTRAIIFAAPFEAPASTCAASPLRLLLGIYIYIYMYIYIHLHTYRQVPLRLLCPVAALLLGCSADEHVVECRLCHA